MAVVIKISEEQTTRFDEYIALQKAIKEMTDQANEIRTEIEQCVHDENPADDQAVIIMVNDNVIEFSVVASSYKFAYDIEAYIHETQAYDTLTVSSTAAKKVLSKEQVEAYFSIDKGSRRLKIK